MAHGRRVGWISCSQSPSWAGFWLLQTVCATRPSFGQTSGTARRRQIEENNLGGHAVSFCSSWPWILASLSFLREMLALCSPFALLLLTRWTLWWWCFYIKGCVLRSRLCHLQNRSAKAVLSQWRISDVQDSWELCNSFPKVGNKPWILEKLLISATLPKAGLNSLSENDWALPFLREEPTPLWTEVILSLSGGGAEWENSAAYGRIYIKLICPVFGKSPVGVWCQKLLVRLNSMWSSREVNCRDLWKRWMCVSGSSWEELATMCNVSEINA